MVTSRQKLGDEMLKLLITLSIYELNTSPLTYIGIPCGNTSMDHLARMSAMN
jgi:hypothetical protein